jgi:hypothetical protein
MLKSGVVEFPQQTGGWSRVSFDRTLLRCRRRWQELAKLWVWMKTTEQTLFVASVSEAHESDYACMRHRRGHAGDAVSNTRSTC